MINSANCAQALDTQSHFVNALMYVTCRKTLQVKNRQMNDGLKTRNKHNH